MTQSPKIGLIVAVALTMISSYACAALPSWQKDDGPSDARVAVTRVIRSKPATEEVFVGSSLPFRHSVIGSAVDGRILELYFDEGDYIDADAKPDIPSITDGDGESGSETEAGAGSEQANEEEHLRPALVQVRTNTLNIQIRSAEAELAVAKEALALLEETLPLEIIQAQYELDSAQATYEFAQGSYDRQVEIQKQNPQAVSRELLGETRSQMLAAKAVLAGAKIRHSVLESTKSDKIEQATASVDVAQAALDLLIDQRNKCSIRAPFSGYITMQHVEVGDWISRGDPVMEIMQLDPLEVRVNVPEEYIGRLRQAVEERNREGKSMTAMVSFEGVTGQEFEGEVVRIVPQADLRTRSFPVLIHVPNPKRGSTPKLPAGLLAKASFGVNRKAESLYVPKDAVVLNDDLYQLVKVIETTGLDGTTTFQPVIVSVQLGESEGSLIEVRGEIEEGDRVVVEGNERVFPGQNLVIVRDDSEPRNDTDGNQQDGA